MLTLPFLTAFPTSTTLISSTQCFQRHCYYTPKLWRPFRGSSLMITILSLSFRGRPTLRKSNQDCDHERHNYGDDDDDANRKNNDDKTLEFQDYQSLFTSQRSETLQPLTLRVIEGSIPADFPLGTYYLIGPGLFSDNYGSTVHPLDGHGYLRAFKFHHSSRGSDIHVSFMAKYVATRAMKEEYDSMTGEWRFKYRGPFSVLQSRQLSLCHAMKVMKNVANTSVLVWGNRLLCLWEGGEPYEMDPNTLDTIGEFKFIGSPKDSPDVITSDTSSSIRTPKELCLELRRLLLKPLLSGWMLHT